MAVVAPMASARVNTATTLALRCLTSTRSAWRRSSARDVMPPQTIWTIERLPLANVARTLGQLELVILDHSNTRREVLVADITLERRRFAKMHTVFERPRRCLHRFVDGDHLDAIHSDLRGDLLVELLPHDGPGR